MPGRAAEGNQAKMNLHRILAFPLVLLLAQCAGTGTSKPCLRGADRDRFTIVAEEVLAASSFTILEGLPRTETLVPAAHSRGAANAINSLLVSQSSDEMRRRDALLKHYFQRELATKKTMVLHGYHFYENSVVPNSADIIDLRKLCSSRHSFAPYGGPGFCGGFHPDFALVWRTGDRTFHFLICLGCDEVKIFGPHTEQRFDIRESAVYGLEQILLKYRKQHRSRGS